MIHSDEKIILMALTTGYFFRGEFIKCFYGKGYQERFDFPAKHRSSEHEFSKLSKVNHWRFIVSCFQISNKGEPKIYDYDPTEIIPLSKKMKIALMKNISGQELSDEDSRLFYFGIGYSFLDMLSTKELEAREQAEKIK